jgi:hypothetical protein
MTDTAAGLSRVDRLIWLLVAAVAAAVLGGSALGFRIDWMTFATPVCTAIALVFAAVYYKRRADFHLASALESTGQVIVFAAVGAPLSYIAASLALPLCDGGLDRIDRAMGFDWLALMTTLADHQQLHFALRLAYASLTVQMTAVVLILGFTGRLIWLRVYALSFIFAALATIAISAVLPAEGVWLHYGLKATGDDGLLPLSHTSWPVFLGLRDGSVRDLVALGADGIITFPSLHSALAVILIAALWPIPIVRWIGLALNVLMLAGTPIDGSHYLTDVLAGGVIATFSLMAARKTVMRLTAAAPADSKLLRKPALGPSLGLTDEADLPRKAAAE